MQSGRGGECVGEGNDVFCAEGDVGLVLGVGGDVRGKNVGAIRILGEEGIVGMADCYDEVTVGGTGLRQKVIDEATVSSTGREDK